MDKYIEEIKQIGPANWAKKYAEPKSLVKSLIKKYATAYYEGCALITDGDFEYLLDVLKILDINDEYLTTPGWGYSIDGGVEHKYGKICSLDYYFDYQDLVKKIGGCNQIIITPKYDGMNFVAYFKSGKLDYCATRGNGIMGKDITKKVQNYNFVVPKQLENQDFAINGEVFLNYDFEKTYHQKARDGVALYLNNDKFQNYDKFVQFIPFSLLNQNYLYDTQLDILSEIIQNQITRFVFDSLPSAEYLHNLYEELKAKFPIDGLVVTNQDKSIQIAYKFKEDL